MTCCTGVFGGDGTDRICKLRLDRLDNAPPKVDDVERVRCRSWFCALPSWPYVADEWSAWTGSVTTELRELVDVRRNCLEASDPDGDGCEITGDTPFVCVLSVGEAVLRRLVGDGDDDIWAGIDSVGTVVRGANGTGFAGRSKAPCP